MPGATFDADESLTTQLLLNAELSTAGATAGFTDMNGDGCTFAGAGFTGAGPVTVAPPSGPARPLHGRALVAIVPNGAPTIVTPTQSCSCNPASGCAPSSQSL
jgi:hypothetical protein